MDRKINSLPALGLYGLLVLVAFKLNAPFAEILEGLKTFVTGGATSIARETPGALELGLGLLALLVMDVLLSLGAIGLVYVLVGKPESKKGWLEDLLDTKSGEMFFIVLLEELLARWLFLGVLASLSNSSWWLYLMFFAGNGLWAAVHVYNHKKASILHTAPQFAGGILLSYAYLRWGFFASVLLHFSFNAVMMAVGKFEELDWKDIAYTIYYAAVAFVAYLVADNHNLDFSALQPWVASAQPGKVGIGAFDVLVLITLMDALLEFVVGGVLCMDKNAPMTGYNTNPLLRLVYLPIVVPIAVLLVMAFTWVAGLLFSTPVAAAVGVAVLFSLSNARTPSSWTRAWFVNMPTAFLCVCTVETMSFWSACLIVGGVSLVGWIPSIIRQAEAEELELNCA